MHQGNDYIRAIHAVGDVIEFYDSDKAFSSGAWGRPQAGARPATVSVSSQAEEAQGVGGIIEAYQNCISTVQLSVPQYSQVIQTAAAMAMSSPRMVQSTRLANHYGRGDTDMDRTIAAICESSSLNLSILIIGVGSANFDKMDRSMATTDTCVTRRQGKGLPGISFNSSLCFAGTGNSAR